MPESPTFTVGQRLTYTDHRRVPGHARPAPEEVIVLQDVIDEGCIFVWQTRAARATWVDLDSLTPLDDAPLPHTIGELRSLSYAERIEVRRRTDYPWMDHDHWSGLLDHLIVEARYTPAPVWTPTFGELVHVGRSATYPKHPVFPDRRFVCLGPSLNGIADCYTIAIEGENMLQFRHLDALSPIEDEDPVEATPTATATLKPHQRVVVERTQAGKLAFRSETYQGSVWVSDPAWSQPKVASLLVLPKED